MPVIDFLERNVKLYGNETALVELNPEIKETRRMTWKEYDLIQPTTDEPYRREITWNVFDEKANRFANMLLSRGVKKGDKVAILMYNCLEWLPIYFGILKTGAMAVPFNFRYSAEEIEYCADLAEVAGPGLRAGVHRPDRERGREAEQGPPAHLRGRQLPDLCRELPGAGLPTAPAAPPQVRHRPTMTTAPSTSPPAPPASPRPFYISTAA